METWLIAVIIIVLILLLIIFVYVVYKLAVSEDGMFAMRKNGFFFDPDTGAVGSFIGIDGEGKDLVDIIYSPLNNPFGKAKLRNVPKNLVPKLTFSTELNVPGVQGDGYMILGGGSHGHRRLFDAIDIDWNTSVTEMGKKLRARDVQLSVVNKEKDQISKGIDSAIAKINARRDEDKDSKSSRRHRPGGGGFDSWSDIDDDDY